MNVPTFRQLSRAGGAALLATDQTYRNDHAATSQALLSGAAPTTSGAMPDGLIPSLERAGVGACGLSRECLGGDGFVWLTQGALSPAQVATDVRAFAEKRPGSLALVVVLSLQPSADMDRRGDSLTPIALAADGTTEISHVYHLDRGYEGLDAKLAGLGADVRREPGSVPSGP